MAYEPSWLGNQLMVLYVPLLMASAIQQTSVFPWKRGWFSVEAGLLGWCLLILALTKSRISQLSLLVVVSAIMIAIGWRALQLVERRLGLSPSTGRGTKQVLLALTNALVLVVLVAGLVAGAGWAASRVDPRLWALPSIRDRLNDVRYTYPNDVAFALTDRLAFAERLVYWTSAFRTFSLYPLLGVGPGNAGFFFEKTLPDYGLQLIEIQKVIREPATGFPNPKNLWARLLAETGMVGFLAFGFWFVALGAGMLLLWRRGSGLDRVLGLAGSIVFLTQCVEGFSLDSYALPQMWLVLGLGTAALTRSVILTADAGHRPALAGSPTKGASREQAPAESSREGPAPRRLSRAALSSSVLADP
jgi:O-antigen ligase